MPIQSESADRSGAGQAKVDSVVLARFDFDDDLGNPDTQGWTMHDRTSEYLDDPYWHVDDFSGLAGYAPLAGARSLWCGARTSPAGAAGGTWPGYGNQWIQFFESVNFGVSGDVQVSCQASYDLEPGYDWIYLEYSLDGSAWVVLDNRDGQAVDSLAGAVPAGSHSGAVRFRLRFTSDGGWSDEDGSYDSYGAVVIDELTVTDGTGVVDHQDFEAETVGALATADGHWTARVAPPFGLHAGLVDGDDVLQEDPAAYNGTSFWSFFNGSGEFGGCTVSATQEIIPYHIDVLGSGLPNLYFRNEVRSPWVALDQDESGRPLVATPGVVSLHFQVYRDLDQNDKVFYNYRYRFRSDGVLSGWVPSSFVYSSTLKDWFTQTAQLNVPAGADEIQVSLGAADMTLTFPFFTGNCHSHSPLFDNVRLVAAGSVVDDFVATGAGLVNAAYGDVDWGDYDADGDLDILLVGSTASGKVARVYRNDVGVFTDIAAPLTAISHGSAEWGDYDNDGDLDLLLAGDTGLEAERAVTRLYRNDAGVFSEVLTGLPGLMGDFADRGLSWGDYDNDGDLDLLIAGRGYPGLPAQYVSAIFRNDGAGAFTDIGAGLPTLASAAVAWADFDVDGDLDLVLCGQTAGGASVSAIYRNDGGGQFADIAAGLAGVHDGSVAWGDFDNDGDPDLALTGFAPGNAFVSRIYRNNGGIFVDQLASLVNLGGGSVDWGDYDADGDLDLLLTGWNGTARFSLVYRNDNGTFMSVAGTGLPGALYGSAGWGDFDNDGRLDLLLAGYNPTDSYFTRVYRNVATTPGSPPAPPTDLMAVVVGDVVTLTWTEPVAATAKTGKSASDGFTFNVRLGTTPGGGEICSGQAIGTTGQRLVARPGNAGQSRSWSAQMPSGWTHLFVSVQTINPNYVGSPFSPELMVEATGVAAVVAPSAYRLHANSPNPFNPRTKLAFEMRQDGAARLEVFDAMGRRVRVLLDAVVVAGPHELDWDGRDSEGRDLASGVYLYRLESGSFSETRRMVLVR